MKNAPKLSANICKAKYAKSNKCKTFQYVCGHFLNQLKTFQNNLSLKWTPLTLPTSKVLSKIPNIKNLKSNNITFQSPNVEM